MSIKMDFIKKHYVILLVLFFTTANLAVSQMSGGYNVSVYTDANASNDFSTLYGVANASDNSSGCSNHYCYSTALTITSPDNRTGSGSQSGKYINIALDIADVAGDYTMGVSMTAYCGCNYGIQFGDGGTGRIAVGFSGTNFKFISNGNGNQCVYGVDCDAPPTCPRDVTSVIVNTDLPCDSYWVQQYGHIHHSNGTVDCYQLPNVYPFPLSGKNGGRAGCT